jgi:hypothetical protein
MLVMFLDLTVAYFAFGAPVGVYQITRTRRSTARSMAVAFLHFVLWPIAAAASVWRSLSIRTEPDNGALELEINALRAEFEAAALDGKDGDQVLEFRDIFACYTGLAMALKQEARAPGKELFEIAGRKDKQLAARCFGRRNRQRLELHLLQARNEFDDAIEKLATVCPEVNEMALRLFGLLEP